MKTIVWDVDDVLNDLMRCWFEQAWLPEHPKTKLKYKEITENPPHQLLGIKKNEYLTSLDAFRVSKEAQEMEPIAEVIDWFNKHGSNFRHIALTARPVDTVTSAANWVFQHFGVWIRSFNFVPAQRRSDNFPRYEQSKGEFLKRLGKIDYVVDDSLKNLKDAQRLKIETILFPRPWNDSQLSIGETLAKIK